MVRVVCGMAMVVLLMCCEAPSATDFFPAHFPAVVLPDDNRLSDARIALGRELFFDPLLSIDSSITCAHCHLPEHAFADTSALSDGVGGALGQRNAPSLYNVAYLGLINKDGGVKNLDLQALVPIEDDHEMGLPVLRLQERLQNNERYRALSKDAYDRPPDAFVVTRALASYVRTLISDDSPYDEYVLGESAALSSSAEAGLQLFESERLGCRNCHSGVLFTDNSFASNGLYVTYQDIGRGLITMDSIDHGKFRIPSLRNVALTGPYMHDGSLKDLGQVIDHYSTVADKQERDRRLRDFELNPMERQQLLDFFASLTGETAAIY